MPAASASPMAFSTAASSTALCHLPCRPCTRPASSRRCHASSCGPSPHPLSGVAFIRTSPSLGQ
eukprot:5587341-Heterocapsa_arctica.AAC.1